MKKISGIFQVEVINKILDGIPLKTEDSLEYDIKVGYETFKMLTSKV